MPLSGRNTAGILWAVPRVLAVLAAVAALFPSAPAHAESSRVRGSRAESAAVPPDRRGRTGVCPAVVERKSRPEPSPEVRDETSGEEYGVAAWDGSVGRHTASGGRASAATASTTGKGYFWRAGGVGERPTLITTAVDGGKRVVFSDNGRRMVTVDHYSRFVEVPHGR